MQEVQQQPVGERGVFHVAHMAGAGIVDWQSYYGQNKIDQWMLPFFGASVYDDPPAAKSSNQIDVLDRNRGLVEPILVGPRNAYSPSQ